jgi:hypothetical protein
VTAGRDPKVIALEIVRARGPIPAERVMSELTGYGIQRGYAYKAVVELIRDGHVKRTFFGEVYVPGYRHSGSGYGPGAKITIVVGLVFIVGVMATILYTAWSRGMLF